MAAVLPFIGFCIHMLHHLLGVWARLNMFGITGCVISGGFSSSPHFLVGFTKVGSKIRVDLVANPRPNQLKEKVFNTNKEQNYPVNS